MKDHGPACMVCGESVQHIAVRCDIPSHCPGGFRITGSRPHCPYPSRLRVDEHDHGASVMFAHDLVSGRFHLGLDGRLYYIEGSSDGPA